MRKSLRFLGMLLFVLLCSSFAALVEADVSVWMRTYGVSGRERANAMILTDDGGYAMTGYTNSFGAGGSDFRVVKTYESGNVEWAQAYGGSSGDVAYSLVATSDGGYAIAGITKSFGAGDSDFWLVKTDEYGVAPEYSSWVVPSILLGATLVIIIYKKKLFNPRSQKRTG